MMLARPQIPILDSDLSSDADDVGDLMVLTSLADAGYADLANGLFLSNSSNLTSAPTARAILNANGYTTTQVGAYMGNDMASDGSFYTDEVTARFRTGDTRANYTDATTLAMSFLASLPNASAVWIATGYGTNLDALLKAEGGPALFAAKVKSLIVIAGDYPTGAEYNFQQSPAQWNYVFANKPATVPTYLWPIAIGTSIVTGPDTGGDSMTSPGLYGYEAALVGGQRPAWAQIALLHHFSNQGAYFRPGSVFGTNSVNASTGANTWTATPGPDVYMAKIAADGTIQAAVQALMDEAI